MKFKDLLKSTVEKEDEDSSKKSKKKEKFESATK